MKKNRLLCCPHPQAARRAWISALVLLVLGTLHASCALETATPGQERVGQRKDRLINGTGTPAHPEVAYFESPTGVNCTAVLIHPAVFLTAANCINFQPSVTGGTLLQADFGQANALPVSETYAFQNGSISFDGVLPPGYGTFDIAIGFLQSPINVSSDWLPARVSGDFPNPNDSVTIFGFGCGITTNCPLLPDKQSLTFGWGTSTTFGEPGDSGGPVFWGLGDANHFANVVALDSGGGKLSQPDAFARPPIYEPRIEGMIRSVFGYEPQTDRPGFDIDPVPGATNGFWSCVDSCRTSSQCVAITFDSSNNLCYRKSARQTPRFAGPTKASWVLQDEDEANDRPGGNYSVVKGVGSTDACRQLCAVDGRCQEFTFVSSNSYCWLKGAFTSPSWSTACAQNGTCQSGVKHAVQVGVDLYGSDSRHASQPSGAACQTWCAQTADCVAYTYITTTQVCYQKYAVPDASADSSMISAVRGGVDYNFDRTGGDYRHFATGTGSRPEICQATCEAESACMAWAFTLDGVCWLKSGIPSKTYIPGRVSGLKGTAFF